MQITTAQVGTSWEPRLDRPSDPSFRPFTSEDLTLRGIMRRITEANLGQSIDLQA
ncbi:hypothetical protein D3C72_454240 [compost metagenome]